MMKNPDPKTDPCFYCTAETGRNAHCHANCERFAEAQILKEAEKKKKAEFDKEHSYFMSEAQKNTTMKNQRKYNRHGTRRK